MTTSSSPVYLATLTFLPPFNALLALDASVSLNLKHNVKTFKLTNVNLYFGDSTKIYKWHTDVLYLDPPWGGPDYKTKVNMDLFLGTIRIDNFLKKIIRKTWKPSYIFIKLPRNYNFERLEDLGLPMHNFTIRGFNLVALEVV